MACVFVGVTSAILFASVMSALSNWGSVELQDAVRTAANEPRFKDLGLTAAELLTWTRRILDGLVLVSIAGVVFSVFAARGHRASRVYLTIMCAIACLMFVATGGWVGLLPSAFAVLSAVRLWSPESKAWFEAKNRVA